MEEPDEMALTNIQHQEPSIYYCYKFYFSTGEVQEGCTEVMGPNTVLGLDLNEYGWVYMTIPIVSMFLLVLIFWALCGSKDPKNLPPQPANPTIFSEPQDYLQPLPPKYDNNPRNLYSVIPMETISNMGGRSTKGATPKPRIYPALPKGSTMRKGMSFRRAASKSVAMTRKQQEAEGLLAEEAPKPVVRQKAVAREVAREEIEGSVRNGERPFLRTTASVRSVDEVHSVRSLASSTRSNSPQGSVHSLESNKSVHSVASNNSKNSNNSKSSKISKSSSAEVVVVAEVAKQ